MDAHCTKSILTLPNALTIDRKREANIAIEVSDGLNYIYIEPSIEIFDTTIVWQVIELLNAHSLRILRGTQSKFSSLFDFVADYYSTATNMADVVEMPFGY